MLLPDPHGPHLAFLSHDACLVSHDACLAGRGHIQTSHVMICRPRDDLPDQPDHESRYPDTRIGPPDRFPAPHRSRPYTPPTCRDRSQGRTVRKTDRPARGCDLPWPAAGCRRLRSCLRDAGQAVRGHRTIRFPEDRQVSPEQDGDCTHGPTTCRFFCRILPQPGDRLSMPLSAPCDGTPGRRGRGPTGVNAGGRPSRPLSWPDRRFTGRARWPRFPGARSFPFPFGPFPRMVESVV